MEARRKINMYGSVIDTLVLMAEGNPGAISVLTQIELIDVFHLDDMNMRGAQIWVAYKDYCREIIKDFSKAIRARDQKMIELVNLHSGLNEVAVQSGAKGRL